MCEFILLLRNTSTFCSQISLFLMLDFLTHEIYFLISDPSLIRISFPKILISSSQIGDSYLIFSVFPLEKRLLLGSLPTSWKILQSPSPQLETSPKPHLHPKVVCNNVVMPTQKKMVPINWLVAHWSNPTHMASASKKGTAIVPLKHVK